MPKSAPDRFRGVCGPAAAAAYWTLEDRRRAVRLMLIEGLSPLKAAERLNNGVNQKTLWLWKRDHLNGKVPLGDL